MLRPDTFWQVHLKKGWAPVTGLDTSVLQPGAAHCCTFGDWRYESALTTDTTGTQTNIDTNRQRQIRCVPRATGQIWLTRPPLRTPRSGEKLQHSSDAKELERDSSIMKQMRKAREERDLASRADA